MCVSLYRFILFDIDMMAMEMAVWETQEGSFLL